MFGPIVHYTVLIRTDEKIHRMDEKMISGDLSLDYVSGEIYEQIINSLH